MKICTFDIEATDLAAVGSGMVLCASIKTNGSKKVQTHRYDELRCPLGKEIRLITAIFDALSDHDMIVGHNIKNFDWPYLKSRAAILGLPIPPPPLFYDTKQGFNRTGFRTVDNGHGKPTASLGHVADFFGIPQRKTSIFPAEHWKSIWLKGEDRAEAMAALVEHCEADVVMTEQVFERLLRYDPIARIERLR